MKYLKKPFLNNVTVCLLLFLTFFAEPENFSIVQYNLIPVRLFGPFLSVFIIIINYKDIQIKNKLFLILNSIFLFFLAILAYTLTFTLDFKTGMGLLFFWFSLFLYANAILLASKDLILFSFFKYYFYIFSILLFLGSVYRYMRFTFKFTTLYFPGYFIQDGNHMAFFIIILFILNFYFFNFATRLYSKILYFLVIFLLGFVFASCDAIGAGILMIFIVINLLLYLLFSKKYKRVVYLLFFCGVFILSNILWQFMPKNSTIESPFFTPAKVEVVESLSIKEASNLKNNTSSEQILSPYLLNNSKSSNNLYNIKYFNPTMVLDFYKLLPNFPASIFAHSTLVYCGFILFLNRPFFGWGLGSFNEAMQATGLHNFFVFFDPSAAGVANYPAHNMYTNYLSETGIMGFVGYISILFFGFALVIKKFIYSKEEKYRFKYFIYILTYVAFMLFTLMYNLHEEFIWFTLLLMALTPLHNIATEKHISVDYRKALLLIKKVIPVFQNFSLIIMIMTSYILERRLIPINANLNYVRYALVFFVVCTLASYYVTKKKIILDNIFYILIAISLFKSVSIFYSYNLFDSVVSSIFWFGLSFLYLSLKNYNITPKKRDFTYLILLAGVINAFFAYVQIVFFYFFNLKILNFYGWIHPFGFRVTGLSYDANHLAAFILLPIFISIYYFIKTPKIIYKLYALLQLIYFAPIFYFSSSRSALIGIFFTLILFPLFFILRTKIFGLISKLYFLIIPLFFVSIFLLFYPSLALKQDSGELNAINSVIYNLTKNIVIHGRGLDGSAFAHFSLVYSSFVLQSQHYYLGTGAGNFAEGLYKNPQLSALFKSLDASDFDGGNFPAHSMYGEALGEGGFIGLVLFLTLLFLILSKYLEVLKVDRSIFPFFIYFYSICFFMLFYNINEEFFWLFTFLGLFLSNNGKTINDT